MQTELYGCLLEGLGRFSFLGYMIRKKKPLSISSHAIIIYLSLDELLSLTLILLCVPTSIRPIITDLYGFEMGGLMRIERLHQNL